MDALDERLIRLLEKDSRQSSEVLAKQLGVSPATVKRRIKKLVQEDVIRHVVVVNLDKVGMNLTAVISLDVAHDKLGSTLRALAGRPEVRWVSTTTGRFDIIVLVHLHSNDELSEFMENVVAKLEGVKDSETSICLRRQKFRYSPAAIESDFTTQH